MAGENEKPDDEQGPRPLPRVHMPLLRDEVRAVRIRRVAKIALVVFLLASSVAGAVVWFRTYARPTDVVVDADADGGIPDLPVAATEATEAETAPGDAGVTDGGVVRVEAPAEHAESAGDPVTEGAVSRRSARFGTAPAFRSALLNAGVSREEAGALEQALTNVLDFRRCRPEHQLVLERDGDNRLVRFEYRSGQTDYVAVTRDAGGTMRGHRVHVPIERVRLVRAGRVTSSLGDALTTAGLGASLVSAFVEAFQGRADFNSDTRQGDVFRISVDEERLHGRFLRYGRVHGLIYDGAGTGHLEAYWFETEGMRAQYYDADGRELRGGWLIAPCRYDHLSSPFNPRRLHPILRRVQPHNGMDFAAATGTPVWAAAAGTVIWAGPKGPNGNLVGISHGGGYQTFYAHLHRIQPGITRGVHVNQRQTIGQVGTTGRSTGPHLHFGLKLNSDFIDPQSVLNGPGRVLPAGPLASFRRQTRAIQRAMLEAGLAASPRAPTQAANH